VEGDQGLGLDPSLLLELPHQAAVGIVLEVEQPARQGGGGLGSEAAAVVEVQPAPLGQFVQHRSPVVMLQIEHHIAEGLGVGIEFHQGPQPVMAIHHPMAAAGATHQGHGLAAQVALPLFDALVAEIRQAAAHLRQAHAHLCGLQDGDRYPQQLPTLLGRRQGLVRG